MKIHLAMVEYHGSSESLIEERIMLAKAESNLSIGESEQNPIRVAEYKLQSKLSADFEGRLPTALADVVRAAMPQKR